MLVRRWRWLLLFIVVTGMVIAPPGGVDPTPAQSTAGWSSAIETSGNPGAYDTSLMTGECRYSRPLGLWQTAVKIPAPAATAITGTPNQNITWEPRVYQMIASGRQFLQSGPLQSANIVNGSKRFSSTTLNGLPQGPMYHTGGRLTWFSDNVEIGAVEFIYLKHDTYNENNQRYGYRAAACSPIAAAEMTLSTDRTTVNVRVRITGRYFPVSAPVSVTWKGASVLQTMSDANGNVAATIPVPAAPLGDYRVGLDASSPWQPSRTLTIVPRVKLIPGTAARGETVKISLRGFAKKESVRIRWLRNGVWVEIGRVTTSNTGSGELWIPVPGWADEGQNSVRGDGPQARAQTNAVTITGGPGVYLTDEAPSPPPEPPNTATPLPNVTGNPATPTPADRPASVELPESDGTPDGLGPNGSPPVDAP